MQDVFISLVGRQISNHRLQLLEAGLEHFAVNLEVIGPHFGVIYLIPANPEETRGIPSALAFLLDDLGRREAEEHGDLAVLPRHESTEIVIGLKAVEKPFADRPLPLPHLGHFVTSNGQERIGPGAADEHLAREPSAWMIWAISSSACVMEAKALVRF